MDFLEEFCTVNRNHLTGGSSDELLEFGKRLGRQRFHRALGGVAHVAGIVVKRGYATGLRRKAIGACGVTEKEWNVAGPRRSAPDALRGRRQSGIRAIDRLRLRLRVEAIVG